MSYEEMMTELNSIINQLESGALNFEQTLELFEKGAELAQKCEKVLSEAKGKITVLSEKLGKLVEEDL